MVSIDLHLHLLKEHYDCIFLEEDIEPPMLKVVFLTRSQMFYQENLQLLSVEPLSNHVLVNSPPC